MSVGPHFSKFSSLLLQIASHSLLKKMLKSVSDDVTSDVKLRERCEWMCNKRFICL